MILKTVISIFWIRKRDDTKDSNFNLLDKKRSNKQYKVNKNDQNIKHKNRRFRRYKQVSNIEIDENPVEEELSFDELKVLYDNELCRLEKDDENNQDQELINTETEPVQMNNNNNDNSINAIETNADGCIIWTFDTEHRNILHVTKIY